ncbi:hypothetical protein [Roseovarius sp. 217]|uniref:hypothetical protein n=1 Tax=Roseovarius sp. (strain 217) TaxID=314264 RepID=UPI0000685513|nr:hypothetical protein [Roseovarius sp. 217]EAQ24705.1 hypothetical protein ROS217_01305 [Roseovarius sp. 217]
MDTTMKFWIAILMATTFSTAAIAQTANVGGDAGVSVGGNLGASVGADVSANVSGNASDSAQNNSSVGVGANANAKSPNYGQLISGLQTGEVSAEMLSDVDADTDTTIVLISDLQGEAAENASALQNALSEQEDNISDLRANIEANATLKEKLEAEGYSVDQVVAVNSTTSGEVTLVVDDNI